MTYQGHINNGTIVLENAPVYPNGTMVVVELVAVDTPSPVEEKELSTLYDRWQSFIGIADDLPEDFAENHDHYAHGRPKQ